MITYDHHIAVMLFGIAGRLGLQVPQSFSLICFNDVFPVALLSTPLTAVSVPARDMGRLSAQQLLNNLAAQGPSATKEIRLSEDLVTRRSTAPPPSV